MGEKTEPTIAMSGTGDPLYITSYFIDIREKHLQATTPANLLKILEQLLHVSLALVSSTRFCYQLYG